MKKTHTIKRITAGLLAVIVLFALSSCKAPDTEKATESEKTTQTEKAAEWVKFDTFEKALKELLTETDTYKMSLHKSTESEDGGKVYTFDIVEELVYSEKHIGLFVHCNGSGDLTSVSCVSTDSVNVDIALISYYVYRSLGLSKMDADTFYDTFAFFEDEPEETYEIEENVWFLKVAYSDDSASFRVIQLDS